MSERRDSHARQGAAPDTAPGDTLNITEPMAGTATTPSGTLTSGPLTLTYTHIESVTGSVTVAPPPTPPLPPVKHLFAVGTDASVPAIVNVFNPDGSLRFALAPYGGFTGGVFVAGGDVNGDGFADVIAGAGNAPDGRVAVINGRDNTVLLSFFAYPGYVGDVRVATTDADGDGRPDILTGAGLGHVKVTSQNQATLESFFAFGPSFATVAFVGGSV